MNDINMKKRGRPVQQKVANEIKTSIIENDENLAQEVVPLSAQESQVFHSKKVTRPKRTPLHLQRVLGAEPREGYVRRWVVEKPGRINRFLQAGWEPVQADVDEFRDPRLQNAGQTGSIARMVVNQNSRELPSTAVLMEMPEETYNADQIHKREIVRAREARIDPKNRQKEDGSFYGKMTVEVSR